MFKRKSIIRKRIATVGDTGGGDKSSNRKSEFTKFEQKEYQNRHGWLGKGIHWEL